MKLRKVVSVLGAMASITRFSQSILAKPENVLEHTGFVAIMSLAIAKEIERQRGKGSVDIGLLLEKCLVHDMDEVSTGDISRPTKYSSKEMLELMESLSARAIVDISNQCQVTFYDNWYDAKKEKTGSIVELSDALSVVYKAHDEVVMRGNKTINFGKPERLMQIVNERFELIEKSYDVSLSSQRQESVIMLDQILEKLK